MSATTDTAPLKDPRRYFEAVDTRTAEAAAPPVCLYLEVTNRCNLLCETCPRTFEELEPPQDMSWELFTSIVDQVPAISRVVMHGVGEPMLVKALPRMIRYLKARGIYTLFNTNGTLLAPRKQRELIETGLDELRVSLDAADAKTFLAVRGKDMFNRIVTNVSSFTKLQKELGMTTPLVSDVVDRAEGDHRAVAGLRAAGGAHRRAGGASAAAGVRRGGVWPGTFGVSPIRASARRGGRGGRCRAGDRGVARGKAERFRRHRAGAEPEGIRGREALGDLPAPVVADVFYRPWPGLALLHCAVFPPVATKITRWGMPPSRICGRSGTARPIRSSAPRWVGETPPKPCQGCGLRWSL